MAGYTTSDVTLEGIVEWTDAPVHLKDFAEKCGVPNLAKVVKGQYRDVGVAKSVQSELYIHTVQTSQKVLAEGVKVKEGKRVVVAGNYKYSLPLSYQGWFELLSQDGKAVKAITTVQELTRSFPSSCIVRENFKAFIPRETGELTLDKFRTLQGGEQLNLVGEIWVTASTSKGMVKRRLLHCLDIKGDSVYMAMEQKGLFSPIAGQTNISGVHNLRGLLDKFRFPILVRLVHGIIPSKLEKNFSGVFRLNGVYSEESIFVCPLKKDAKMVPISTREPLRLISAANFEEVKMTEGYQYHTERCNKMIASYMNSIHLLFTMPDPNAVRPKKDETVRSKKSTSGKKENTAEAIEEDILFHEVEDIYAYVREGGPAPPPPRPRPPPGAVSMVQKTPSRTQSVLRDSPKADNAKSKKDQERSAVNKSPVVIAPSPGKSPSPKSPSPKSPSPKSPSPTLPFTPGKDDFWEEPIYEPLDKIQRNKRGKKATEETIPAPALISDTHREHHMHQQDLSSPTGLRQSPSFRQREEKEVQNLRQVYKLSHENVNTPMGQSGMHVNDDQMEELNEMLYDINAPPVPPKKFADTDAASDISEGDSLHTHAVDRVNIDRIHLKPEMESVETMTFDDEAPISPTMIPRIPSPLRRSPSPNVQSSMPVSQEPTVTVHTPMLPRPSVSASQSLSTSQPLLSPSANVAGSPVSPVSPPVGQSLSQSHEMLTPPHHPPQRSTTFVYRTSVPSKVQQNGGQNGYHHQQQSPAHTVLLNKPRDPKDVHVLNRRATTNGPRSPPSATLPHPGTAYARSGGGGGDQARNRHSMMGGGNGQYSNSSHAPYVAVARVGSEGSGGGGGGGGDPYPESRQLGRRRMQTMYL